MNITSFKCIAKNNNIVWAELISSILYTDTYIYIAEYSDDILVRDWDFVEPLVSTTQIIEYAIKNNLTNFLQVKIC